MVEIDLYISVSVQTAQKELCSRDAAQFIPCSQASRDERQRVRLAMYCSCASCSSKRAMVLAAASALADSALNAASRAARAAVSSSVCALTLAVLQCRKAAARVC
jgi:hypothetical protein